MQILITSLPESLSNFAHCTHEPNHFPPFPCLGNPKEQTVPVLGLSWRSAVVWLEGTAGCFRL